MPIRAYPEEYFQNQNENLKYLKWGAILVIVGVLLGALIMYIGGKNAH